MIANLSTSGAAGLVMESEPGFEHRWLALTGLGVAVAGYLPSQVSLTDSRTFAARTSGVDVSSISNDQLSRFPNGAHPVQGPATTFPGQGKVAIAIGHDAFAAGFSALIWMFAACTALGLVLCLLLRRPR